MAEYALKILPQQFCRYNSNTGYKNYKLKLSRMPKQVMAEILSPSELSELNKFYWRKDFWKEEV